MAYTNVHGRRAGRGIRPWLLVPKSLAVGIFLGTVVTTSSIWFTTQTPLNPTQPIPQAVIEQVSFIFRFLTVPALLTAMAFGIMLFLQHPAVFSRLRWWQVKIITLAIGVPAAHFFMSSRLATLRQAAITGTPNPTAEHQLTLGLLAIVAVTVWLIVLGRLKPRLGQNWAATYQQLSRSSNINDASPNTKTQHRVFVFIAIRVGGAKVTRHNLASLLHNQVYRPTSRCNSTSQVIHQQTIRCDRPLNTCSNPTVSCMSQRGPTVTRRLYPPLTRIITHSEYEDLIRHVLRCHLMAEPTSPASESPDATPRYEVVIIANGRTHRYTTTPAESPPTIQLLQKLVRTRTSTAR